MKKFLSLVVLLLCVGSGVKAQTFDLGDQVLSAGIGVGGDYGFPVSLYYEGSVYEVGTDQFIGIGAYAGYSNYKEEFIFGDYKYSNILMSLGANYHYTVYERVDFYGGFRVGYNIASSSAEWDNAKELKWYGDTYDGEPDALGGVIYSVHIGMRCYISKRVALGGELGFGTSILTLGVSYKL